MRNGPQQAFVRDEQDDEIPTMQDNYRSQTRGATEDTEFEVQLSPPVEEPFSNIPRDYVESQIAIGEQFSELTISSPMATRASSRLLSPDVPLPSVEGADLITVRDLPNATPRPSPSPEPARSSTLDLGSEMNSDRPSEVASCEDQLVDLPDFGALSLGDEEAHFVPYNVDAEALPPNPCFDRDYQQALRTAKTLAGNVHNELSQCEMANGAGTQLHRITQRAAQLSRFDSPASRTIGIVGDSAAGTSLLLFYLTPLMKRFREK